MKISTLTSKIEDWERDLAYGSETVLWGEYYWAFRGRIGEEDTLETSELEISEDEAQAWLQAYEKMKYFEDAGKTYDLSALF